MDSNNHAKFVSCLVFEMHLSKLNKHNKINEEPILQYLQFSVYMRFLKVKTGLKWDLTHNESETCIYGHNASKPTKYYHT